MEFELEIPKKQFKEHIAIPKNNRIIFSGAFGTGKTYFLDKFFKDQDKYEAIHIYPVNYSVASNEDIFELIKYDVLFKLLEKGLDFDKVYIDKGTFLPFFLKNHATEIIPFLLGVIPKVGASLKEIAQGLIKLNNKFEKEFKEANLTDQDRIISYLEGFTKTKGSINEEDFYTQLICSLVNQLKEEGKEIALIIDDLDRIDPEHIFRILNVLAAHVDVKKDSDENKFDFNKIILVCDIENIRKIFSNRYGADVDFSGYIDKFYSRSIFHYDLSGEMISDINKVFQSVKINDGIKEKNLNEDKSNAAAFLIKYILLSMLQYNLIPIRSLKRILYASHILKERKIWRSGQFDSVSNKDIALIKAMEFILFLFQSHQTFVEKCESLIGKEIKNPLEASKSFLFTELVKAASLKKYYSLVKKADSSNQESNFVEKVEEFHFRFTLQIKPDKDDPIQDKHHFKIQKVGYQNNDVPLENLDFFRLLTWLLKKSEIKQVITGGF